MSSASGRTGGSSSRAASRRPGRRSQDTIRRRDPLCRGVLVLGLAADARSLASAFRAAAPFELVKGFAVGRTIFARPARRRLAGEIERRRNGGRARRQPAGRRGRLARGPAESAGLSGGECP